MKTEKEKETEIETEKETETEGGRGGGHRHRRRHRHSLPHHVLPLAAHTNERALLILNAEVLAGSAIEDLECILVRVHHRLPRDLVWVRLEHAHLPVVIRHVTNNLPVNLAVLVREGPPLGVGMLVHELLGARSHQQRDH